MAKRVSELTGHPVDLMKEIAADEALLKKYYHFDSKVWRRIVDHIWKAQECVLIDLATERHGEEVGIRVHRGTGPGIRLIEAHSYNDKYESGKKPVPASVFCIELAVEYCNEYGSNEFERTYYLNVPVILEDPSLNQLHFDKEWDRWIAEMTEKRRQEKIEKLREHIKGFGGLERVIEVLNKSESA